MVVVLGGQPASAQAADDIRISSEFHQKVGWCLLGCFLPLSPMSSREDSGLGSASHASPVQVEIHVRAIVGSGRQIPCTRGQRSHWWLRTSWCLPHRWSCFYPHPQYFIRSGRFVLSMNTWSCSFPEMPFVTRRASDCEKLSKFTQVWTVRFEPDTLHVRETTGLSNPKTRSRDRWLSFRWRQQSESVAVRALDVESRSSHSGGKPPRSRYSKHLLHPAGWRRSHCRSTCRGRCWRLRKGWGRFTQATNSPVLLPYFSISWLSLVAPSEDVKRISSPSDWARDAGLESEVRLMRTGKLVCGAAADLGGVYGDGFP